MGTKVTEASWGFLEPLEINQIMPLHFLPTGYSSPKTEEILFDAGSGKFHRDMDWDFHYLLKLKKNDYGKEFLNYLDKSSFSF